jgi:hypothetical protein
MLARISRAGLASIAALVAILWSCILGEHLIVKRANREFSRAMFEIRLLQMRKQTVPASLPAAPHRVRPAIG